MVRTGAQDLTDNFWLPGPVLTITSRKQYFLVQPDREAGAKIFIGLSHPVSLSDPRPEAVRVIASARLERLHDGGQLWRWRVGGREEFCNELVNSRTARTSWRGVAFSGQMETLTTTDTERISHFSLSVLHWSPSSDRQSTDRLNACDPHRGGSSVLVSLLQVTERGWKQNNWTFFWRLAD